MQPLFRSACSASVYSSTGLPEARLRTQTPCQFAGDLMPVPSAFVNASLAGETALARTLGLKRFPPSDTL